MYDERKVIYCYVLLAGRSVPFFQKMRFVEGAWRLAFRYFLVACLRYIQEVKVIKKLKVVTDELRRGVYCPFSASPLGQSVFQVVHLLNTCELVVQLELASAFVLLLLLLFFFCVLRWCALSSRVVSTGDAILVDVLVQLACNVHLVGDVASFGVERRFG